MATPDTNLSADIIIIGGGIAGLWTLARLRKLGYDALLLERDGLGGGQSIASQGIIHSGLKYTLAGKISNLAQSISAMPDRWRAALNGTGDIDLNAAKIAADSQQLLIPGGMIGGITKIITQQLLGSGARDIPRDEWPEGLQNSGFKGSAVHMGEPVLDIPSVIRAIADQHGDCIKILDPAFRRNDEGVYFDSGELTLSAKMFIFTAAGSNQSIAQSLGHDAGLETQTRPLLMGMAKNAPFPLFAHCVGTSDKPVATITTHQDANGNLVWYMGGQVAERPKNSPPEELYKVMREALAKYLPDVDQTRLEFAALPIERIEGKSGTSGWLPDTPTIHEAGNALYCWPTKLTFAPLLGDMIVQKLQTRGIKPSGALTNWGFLPDAPFAKAPWD